MIQSSEKIQALCKRRGFVYPSSALYGGLNGCWDYGPMGVELVRNIRESWWRAMTGREDVDGLEASILMNPQVWRASGHVDHFTDPLVDCRSCKGRFRADADDFDPPRCPACGATDSLTEPRPFNLMFQTQLGAVEDEGDTVYLRPETAQSAYVNFAQMQMAMRPRLPWGLAQIGRVFRNEIKARNFLFRAREFEQMELQYFVYPGTEDEQYEHWRQRRWDWLRQLGLPADRLRWHEHGPDERAHYARAAVDIQFHFPFGWGELEGIHNRGDFDLAQHECHSGKALRYFDAGSDQQVRPSVIETSVGSGRLLQACLSCAYREEDVKGRQRVVMGFNPRIAPVKIGVFPLLKGDGMAAMAKDLSQRLRDRFSLIYDEQGAIGRRYRRMDEIGTPYCITVDAQSLQDETVTLRHRDTMAQERVMVAAVAGEVAGRIEGWVEEQ